MISTVSYGQYVKELNIYQAVDLALQNQQQLKVSTKTVEITKQQKQLTKLQSLPSLSISSSANYIGNVVFFDKNFSESTTLKTPHFGNSFALLASQLLFKGGAIKKSIEVSTIKEQIAELDFEKDKQNIKFLIISNYLDYIKLINQKKVYENNRDLAQQRLNNVKKYYREGIITRNEVIRNELILQNIEQSIFIIDNNKNIINYNLNVMLGLPETTEIVPTENTEKEFIEKDKTYYLNLAYENNPSLKAAKKNIDIAKKNIEIINTDKYPTLSAIGGYNIQRPLTNNIPFKDIYANTWQVGISLTYNIDNLYKTRKKVEMGYIQKSQSDEVLKLVEKNIETGINTAYIKYKESIQNAIIFLKSEQLAQENYKIIESKYLNQLAIQTEMIDATNSKIESELQYINAKITILYQYYNLIRETGTL